MSFLLITACSCTAAIFTTLLFPTINFLYDWGESIYYGMPLSQKYQLLSEIKQLKNKLQDARVKHKNIECDYYTNYNTLVNYHKYLLEQERILDYYVQFIALINTLTDKTKDIIDNYSIKSLVEDIGNLSIKDIIIRFNTELSNYSYDRIESNVYNLLHKLIA